MEIVYKRLYGFLFLTALLFGTMGLGITGCRNNNDKANTVDHYEESIVDL